MLRRDKGGQIQKEPLFGEALQCGLSNRAIGLVLHLVAVHFFKVLWVPANHDLIANLQYRYRTSTQSIELFATALHFCVAQTIVNIFRIEITLSIFAVRAFVFDVKNDTFHSISLHYRREAKFSEVSQQRKV